MKLKRLDHFGLDVTDLERAERFYTEVLGLSVVGRFGDQVMLQCGDQNLALFQVAGLPISPGDRAARIAHPLGQRHHAFRVSNEDFLDARDQLVAAGMESARPINWGDHDCIYFLDPDGNLLEIVTYR